MPALERGLNKKRKKTAHPEPAAPWREPASTDLVLKERSRREQLEHGLAELVQAERLIEHRHRA